MLDYGCSERCNKHYYLPWEGYAFVADEGLYLPV